MANTTLVDGTGTGSAVQITDTHKLMTLAVTEAISAHHAFEETAFNINTGNITLTSGSASSILYMKNDGDKAIIIESFIYNLTTSTNGSGYYRVSVERNPTGGTLVSGGTAFAAVNRNFSSSKTMEATILKGAEGSTSSGGTTCLDSLFPSSGRQVISVGAIVLPRGTSLSVTVTPPSGNTSMTCQVAMSVYVEQENTKETR